MDPQPTIPAPEAPIASAPAEAVAASTPLDRKVAMMEELAELSMQMARAAARRALAAEAVAEAAEVAAARAEALPPAYVAPPYPAVPSEPTPGADADALAASAAAIADPHLAFHRAARAVRTSVALWRSLEREKDAEVAAAALAADAARRARAAERRLAAGRIVERVAHDHFETAIPGKSRDAEAILAAHHAGSEARERLEDESLYADLADQPLSEIVARVCRDAGVSPDWARLAEEDWAQAELGGGPEGSGPVGKPLADFIGEHSSGGPRSCRLPPQQARPPRSRSARWVRRRDETPPEPLDTLRVLFVEPDGKGGFTEEEYRPDATGRRRPPPTPPPPPPPASASAPASAKPAELDLVSPPARNAPMDIANPWLD